MSKRPAKGRALFYTRDSSGRSETTPGEYVRWAQQEARWLGISFDGTPERIDTMIRNGEHAAGDLFLDYGVSGHEMSRPGLNAFMSRAISDLEVSHALIPRRDRLARPDDPLDGMRLEGLLGQAGVTLVFQDRIVPPVPKGARRDFGELIVGVLDYTSAGQFRTELGRKIALAQIALARLGFSNGDRAPFGFRRCLVRADGTAVRELTEGEHVRMAGHHVVWLPGPEAELEVIRRIVEMLETMPA